MTKPETQLTPHKKAIERFAGKKCGEFEPHCFACMAWEVLPSWLENEQQALTTLKSEMEKAAITVHGIEHANGVQVFDDGMEAVPLSECQRLLERKLK